MKLPRTSCFFTLAALIFSIPLQPASAQNERLVLNATVIYEGKQPLPTFEAGDFTVLVDKEPQKIVSLNHGNAPVSVGILVDISGSTFLSKKAFDHIADGIDKLFQVGNPQNEYFVAAFQSKPSMVHTWTNDWQAIRSKLQPLEFKGQSALYDGLYSAVQYVKTGRHQKKVVIVLSDGMDNNSVRTFKEVRECLKESDVVLHAIALLDDESSAGALGEEGKSILTELTTVSGGQTLLFEYSSKAKSITEAFEQIGTDVRSQYELVVEPPQQTMPRKWRKLKVTATYTDANGKRKELKVRTREGFFR
jgi:Ca-activated chloride channel homolog